MSGSFMSGRCQVASLCPAAFFIRRLIAVDLLSLGNRVLSGTSVRSVMLYGGVKCYSEQLTEIGCYR